MNDIITIDGGSVRTIVLNRPSKRNALSVALYRQLDEAISAAAIDDTIRTVVIRGKGPMFSAGNDIDELNALAEDPDQVRVLRPLMVGAFNRLEEMAKPTIAQLHGACIGGAFELALACDLRVAAEGTQLGLIEARVGLVPDLGGTSRLPAVVGVGRAKEMIMTGQLIDAEEAHRIGLITRLAPADQLDQATSTLVRELQGCAPRAIAAAKHIIDASARPALAATLELEVDAQEVLATTDDFREGVRALSERRPAHFGDYNGHSAALPG